jgi:murein DD-endopeptidase MepM/ murein hydrolase activator NlpD
VKFLLVCLFSLTSLFSSTIELKTWGKGESLLTFFKKHNIAQEVYFNLSKTDKELCSEIVAGTKFQILKNENNEIEQTLIPISEEMQLHIVRENTGHSLDIIPIEFATINDTVTINVQNNPYQDIIEATNNPMLARELMVAFKKSIPFKKMQKGNHIVINYNQRVRMGEYFGAPQIISAMVEIRKQKYYIFKNEKDDRYYDEEAKSMTSFFLKVPLRYTRISSKFTYKRYHPILKRYRAHLGIDYAAPTGRKIFAAASGRIAHKARKGGYGKTVIIKHKNGYKSLYAHMHNYARGIKVGQYVKQGTHIGYVGTTGRSTGPHLHFGLYKNGRAVNPNKVIRVTKNKLKGDDRKQFLSLVKKEKKLLLDSIEQKKKPLKLEGFDVVYEINSTKV